MGKNLGESDKRYEAFRIFEHIYDSEENPAASLPGDKNGDMYYEIEYDSCPMPGVGKFVLKPSKVEAPQRDEIRETFNQMRNVSRESRQLRYHTRFYDKRVQEENARIFYEQGMFMVDFEDTYEKSVSYSSYFPDYQMMGYDQLRTYFTWRTKVRQGDIADISLSYAFLYIYELLNNIGVEDPLDGLDRLMSFWDAFRVYDKTIDKYVLKWLKDYHIYYELPHSFHEFTEKNNLEGYYPELANMDDNFDLFCSISKYDIRKSAFYGENRHEIKDCFHHVMDELKGTFEQCGINLEEFIFQPTKNMSVWTPFRDALFYPHLKQNDRRVVMSEKEIYVCSGNNWTFHTSITTDSGKRLIGYCLKQMESVMRKVKNYKYKLSADISMLSPMMAEELGKSGISLEAIVARAAMEFHREANKTVVRVDREALERIRQEALITQEKLIVPEQEMWGIRKNAQKGARERAKEDIGEDVRKEIKENINEGIEKEVWEDTNENTRKKVEIIDEPKKGEVGEEFIGIKKELEAIREKTEEEIREECITDISQVHLGQDVWKNLDMALTEVERKALSILLHGNGDIRKYADQQNIMLEVLVDGINEKATDYVGDSLLDGEFAVYEDYLEQVKEMVEGI